MINYSPGLGTLLLLAIVLLLYTPFISIRNLGKLRAFDKISVRFKSSVKIIIFFLFAGLTLLLIRANPYASLQWILLYAAASTVMYFAPKLFAD